MLELPKNAKNDEINKACFDIIYLFDNSLLPLDDEKYEPMPSWKRDFFRSKMDVEDIRHMLTNPILRDIYDKNGMFTTKTEFNQRNGQIPQSMRYLQAVGATMNYSMFFVMIFFLIDKHVRIMMILTRVLAVVSLCQATISFMPSHLLIPCHLHEIPQGR
jgi:hypothetical protein